MTDGLAKVNTALKAALDSSHDAAWTMPSAFYTDPDFTRLEVEHLFKKEWHCVGRIEEIAEKGQWMPYRLANEPLVITHGTDGKIRALSNVCRHRGTLIATEKGKGRRLLCPYHHWAYDMTGQLKAAPKIEERDGFTVKGCKLPEFRCETWMGFIYVNLEQDAAPFAPSVAELEAKIAPYHMEEMWLGYILEETWETNWKSMIDNYMEGYHLSPLHKTGLANLNPTDMCEHLTPGEHWFGYSVGFPEDLPRVTSGHPDCTKEQSNTCIMAMVQAGSGIGLGADYSSFLCLQPEGPDKVRYKAGVLFWGEWPQSAVDPAIELFQQTMEEDRSVLEPMMLGYASDHHAPGPLAPAPLEGNILDLARYVGRRLGPALDATA
ncbi:MAG: aromatic ring-hydroxylating dioxygenase subunit alpha [Alphaproteobacteria bacterium]|nr:aromatic ring-hydroxylating dioxygenase subunit alpha [Alphaproteobacteria bacterium]